jgi:hypothetical protein
MTSITDQRIGLSGTAARSQFWDFVQTQAFGAVVALLSLFGIALYAFAVTDYNTLLYSDMQAYWMRALDRLNGDPFHETQFWVWPAGYHIFLAELFRFLRWVGLEGWIRLETALSVNILAYSASVYALHCIAVRWLQRPQWILVVLLLYAFGFPAWYFNAFLLAENLAAPFFLIAVALIYRVDDWRAWLAAAVIFAFATIIRPSLGPYGLAFVLYCLIRAGSLNWRCISRAALFSVVFFALIIGFSAEVARISQGKVVGLSPNSGLDFFLANVRYHRIDLNYDGWHNYVVAPALSLKPENGRFYTGTPYYHQEYYYDLGWRFIQHNPEVLLKNFEHVWHLAFARMLPSRETPGFVLFRPLWDVFKFIMFLSLPLYLWLWRETECEHRPLLGFLLSVIGLTVLVSYLFTGEPRYTFAIIFVFYLLFFKLVEIVLANRPPWKKVWLPFVLLLGFITVTAQATVMVLNSYPDTVLMRSQPIADTPPEKLRPVTEVGRVLFPFSGSGTLNQADSGYPFNTPTRISMLTNMEILSAVPLQLQFDICSAWPVKILIDGNPWIEELNPQYFFELNALATLNPGIHTIEVIFDYVRRDGGFAVSYNYFSDNWRHRNTLGVSDDLVRFSLPEVTSGESSNGG